MDSIGIFPRLSTYCQLGVLRAVTSPTYLGEGAVIPEVTVVREAIADVSELALFYVLLDRVQGFFFGDL